MLTENEEDFWSQQKSTTKSQSIVKNLQFCPFCSEILRGSWHNMGNQLCKILEQSNTHNPPKLGSKLGPNLLVGFLEILGVPRGHGRFKNLPLGTLTTFIPFEDAFGNIYTVTFHFLKGQYNIYYIDNLLTLLCMGCGQCKGSREVKVGSKSYPWVPW